MQQPTSPCMLIILDGWGIGQAQPHNAVRMADTPFLDHLLKTYRHTRLKCSGEAVGLPPGTMGNSEVGHMNIGAGRVVFQDLLRINAAIADGGFDRNRALNQAIEAAKDNHGTLHLIGLVSDGGVHSHIDHLLALLDLVKRRGLSNVRVHAITDGRDTAPDSGRGYLARLQEHIERLDNGAVASVCGRYYAMDRDTRWDRTQRAYQLYTAGQGLSAPDPLMAVDAAYARGESDEFIQPVAMTDNHDRPLGLVRDGDAVVFFNFRADRARQITRALTEPDFSAFTRQVAPRLGAFVCMTQYDAHFGLPVAFEPVHPTGILGEVISAHGLQQLRIAETEKYAHVTYFFNGGQEKPFRGEDRCLIPSPRDVATYDQKPGMSAVAVTEELLSRLDSGQYAFVVLNFANMDMVGHTGVLQAAIAACETVDSCLERIVPAVLALGGVALVTADHGNSETMVAANGKPHTAHTLNPVRLVLVDDNRRRVRLREGILGDIAPTILHIMGLAQPAEMTGRSLIEGGANG